MDFLQEYYEIDSERFWNPLNGLTGRDKDIYPLLDGEGGEVIEYGCGAGSLLIGLANEDRFSKCVGVDISNSALEKIRRLIKSDEGLGKKVELLQPENDKLNNLCTGSFDISISVATIEHVINPYIVLDELYRVTKKDGVLICSVPNYAYIKHIVSLLLGRQPKTGTNLDVKYWRNDGWDGMHLHTFTKSSFNTLLVDCGWKPIKWLGCGEKFNWTGLGYIRRNFPGRWSGELIVKCKKI